MFRIRNTDDLLLPNDISKKANLADEDLTPNNYKNAWDWYCPNRLDLKNNISAYKPEIQLYEYLHESVLNGVKKVILIHGGTGYGKTTFMCHFFQNYLSKHDPELAEKTIAVRLSLGIAGMTIENLEDDVDNKISKYLDQYFPEFYNDDKMIELADLIVKFESDFHTRLKEQYPAGGTQNDKINWINKIVGRASTLPECNNVFADFNRLRIQYLTQKLGKKFIIIFDNIDQTISQVQEAAFMLARHKLEWVQDTNNVYILIAMRSYMLSKASKELPIAAYQERYEVAIRPCHIRDILNRRVHYVYDNLPEKIQFQEDNIFQRKVKIEVEKDTIKDLINKWIDVFGKSDTDLELSRMTNDDMREQLRMVKEIFRSPNIDWLKLCDAIKSSSSIYISQDKLLDVLIRGNNILCNVESPVFFINLFDSNKYQHFSNTLNRIYILKIMKKNRCEDVQNIAGILAYLGHPQVWTLENIEIMLKRNILNSPEGLYLREDNVKRIYFDMEETYLATFYIDVLINKLYYLQSMAYLTPLSEKWLKILPLPENIGDEIDDFTTRIDAAIALVGQVEDDEKKQKEILTTPKALEIFKTYQLDNVAQKMKFSIRTQLELIRKQSHLSKLDWDLIINRF
jgi:hypothetical protein